MPIIVDTEYTTWPGALESGWAAPDQHREIVQIAALRVDNEWREITPFEHFVKPFFNPELSPLFVELTGITQELIDNYGNGFARAMSDFRFFCGGEPVICMNADEAVFRENCALLQIEFDMPSFHRLRPYLERVGVNLDNVSSGDLHQLTDTPLLGQTHNALHDVRSMAAWLRHSGLSGHDLNPLPTGAPTTDPRSAHA